MKIENYNAKQIDRLTTEIEGRLNDFEGGISSKDETILNFISFIMKIAQNVAIGELDRVLRYWENSFDSETYIAINSRLTQLREDKINP